MVIVSRFEVYEDPRHFTSTRCKIIFLHCEHWLFSIVVVSRFEVCDSPRRINAPDELWFKLVLVNHWNFYLHGPASNRYVE